MGCASPIQPAVLSVCRQLGICDSLRPMEKENGRENILYLFEEDENKEKNLHDVKMLHSLRSGNELNSFKKQ